MWHQHSAGWKKIRHIIDTSTGHLTDHEAAVHWCSMFYDKKQRIHELQLTLRDWIEERKELRKELRTLKARIYQLNNKYKMLADATIEKVIEDSKAA